MTNAWSASPMISRRVPDPLPPERVGSVIKRVGSVIKRVGSVIKRVGFVIKRVGSVIKKNPLTIIQTFFLLLSAVWVHLNSL